MTQREIMEKNMKDLDSQVKIVEDQINGEEKFTRRC